MSKKFRVNNLVMIEAGEKKNRMVLKMLKKFFSFSFNFLKDLKFFKIVKTIRSWAMLTTITNTPLLHGKISL